MAGGGGGDVGMRPPGGKWRLIPCSVGAGVEGLRLKHSTVDAVAGARSVKSRVCTLGRISGDKRPRGWQ